MMVGGGTMPGCDSPSSDTSCGWVDMDGAGFSVRLIVDVLRPLSILELD